jgi:hypothetical protein
MSIRLPDPLEDEHTTERVIMDSDVKKLMRMRFSETDTIDGVTFSDKANPSLTTYMNKRTTSEEARTIGRHSFLAKLKTDILRELGNPRVIKGILVNPFASQPETSSQSPPGSQENENTAPNPPEPEKKNEIEASVIAAMVIARLVVEFHGNDIIMYDRDYPHIKSTLNKLAMTDKTFKEAQSRFRMLIFERIKAELGNPTVVNDAKPTTGKEPKKMTPFGTSKPKPVLPEQPAPAPIILPGQVPSSQPIPMQPTKTGQSTAPNAMTMVDPINPQEATFYNMKLPNGVSDFGRLPDDRWIIKRNGRYVQVKDEFAREIFRLNGMTYPGDETREEYDQNEFDREWKRARTESIIGVSFVDTESGSVIKWGLFDMLMCEVAAAIVSSNLSSLEKDEAMRANKWHIDSISKTNAQNKTDIRQWVLDGSGAIDSACVLLSKIAKGCCNRESKKEITELRNGLQMCYLQMKMAVI